MSKEEIEILKNNTQQLIALNGFLSTSLDKAVAESYSHEVLFIIDTTFAITHGSFANVAPFSHFPNEREVLFNLASVFKIVDVNFDDNSQK